MRCLSKMLLSTLAATVALLGGGSPHAASATELTMANLRVLDSASAWQATELFRLDWDQVPGPPALPSAVVYRLYGPDGNPLGPATTVTDELQILEWVQVPPLPGNYTIEAWLLDANGEPGPPATAALRFDNQPPLPPLPQAPSGWLLGTEPALLQVAAPPLPHPLSGIRGYEISLVNGKAGSLYLDASAGSSVSLGTLPEGTTVARVAAVSGAGIPSEPATATFRVDATAPELSLQGAPTGWSDSPVRVSAQAQDALSGMAAAGPNGPFTAITVDGAAPALAWGERVSTWVTGSGVHEVEVSARDAAGNVLGGKPGALSPTSTLVRIDEDPPRVAFSLAQDPSEPERIEATVTDPLSGPSPARGSIALRPAGTLVRFEELPTRMVGERLISHWDSDAYPHGKYEFRATGFDVAGNSSSTSDRAYAGKMVLVNPVKAQVSLEADLADKRLEGRLRHFGGTPLAEQEVVVKETFVAGAYPQQRITAVRSGPDGTFSLRLRPGPSRDVVATYAGNRLLTRAAGTSARLDAPTAVRLRASSSTAKIGGKPIVFSGKVGALGAKRSVRGLPVELQFRYPGAGWSAFRTIETDRRGRFRYAYRFSDDDSRGVRFQFRAYVKGREGWPYEPSTSRPISVTGR
jgi:hypothetical protein